MITQIEALKIAETLIADSFPELRSSRIRYKFVTNKDYYMAVWSVIFGHYLAIDKIALSFSKKAFKGCLSHELAHLVIDKKRSFFEAIYATLFTKRNLSEIEREADQMVIDRGLGEELFQFHKEHGKEYKAYKATEGLTKQEIKKKLKSLK